MCEPFFRSPYQRTRGGLADDVIKVPKEVITILHQNMRCISNKIPAVEINLQTTNVDILLASEH